MRFVIPVIIMFTPMAPMRNMFILMVTAMYLSKYSVLFLNRLLMFPRPSMRR